jgi:hypothetical protein
MSQPNTGRAETTEDLGGLLLDSLDEALVDLMGARFRQPFYHYFEERYGITRDVIPYRLDEFVVSLAELFGVLAMKTFGRAIAKRLYLKLGLEFSNQEEYTLLDYVKEARMNLPLLTKTSRR